MKKFNKDRYLRKLKLKRYWQNNSRYFYIGIPCLLCLILGIYFAYSKFFVSSEEEVIRTTVGEFIYGDIIMTPYVDGQYSSTFPEKKTGINVEKVICDGGVSASWDEDKWGLYVTNLSKRTKCSVYFVTPASCGINDNVSCINSREGLATLANEVNNGDNKSGKIIYLTSDLDLGGKFDSDGNALDGNISWTPIGTESNPFSGTFDGNGHIISNMYININDNASLFNYSSNSTFKNVGVVNSYVKSVNGHASSIVGEITNGIIENSFSNSTIIGQKFTAGLVSRSFSSDIINCYNTGNIFGDVQFAAGAIGYQSGDDHIIRNIYNYGNVKGGIESGGIVGGIQGTVMKTYNLGKIECLNNYCGGLVGQAYLAYSPRIYNSYNSGKVEGFGILGTLNNEDGTHEGGYKIMNNYYLSSTASWGIGEKYDGDVYSKVYSNDGAEPLSQDQMPSVISVINGDNAFVEDTNNINNGYPILKWQAERENN